MTIKGALTATAALLLAALNPATEAFSPNTKCMARLKTSTLVAQSRTPLEPLGYSSGKETEEVALVHKKKEPTIRRNVFGGEVGERGEGYVLLQGILMAFIFFGHVPAVGGSIMMLMGPGLFLFGLITMLRAAFDMGSSLCPWIAPPENGTLVTTGLYSQMRHPIYAGLLWNCLGLGIATGSVERLLLTGLLFLTLNKQAEIEEDLLKQKFPDYEAYMELVPGRFYPDSSSSSEFD